MIDSLLAVANADRINFFLFLVFYATNALTILMFLYNTKKHLTEESINRDIQSDCVSFTSINQLYSNSLNYKHTSGFSNIIINGIKSTQKLSKHSSSDAFKMIEDSMHLNLEKYLLDREKLIPYYIKAGIVSLIIGFTLFFKELFIYFQHSPESISLPIIGAIAITAGISIIMNLINYLFYIIEESRLTKYKKSSEFYIKCFITNVMKM